MQKTNKLILGLSMSMTVLGLASGIGVAQTSSPSTTEAPAAPEKLSPKAMEILCERFPLNSRCPQGGGTASGAGATTAPTDPAGATTPDPAGSTTPSAAPADPAAPGGSADPAAPSGGSAVPSDPAAPSGGGATPSDPAAPTAPSGGGMTAPTTPTPDPAAPAAPSGGGMTAPDPATTTPTK